MLPMTQTPQASSSDAVLDAAIIHSLRVADMLRDSEAAYLELVELVERMRVRRTLGA